MRELLRVKQEVFMPLMRRVGEAQVDFGYALAKVSGEFKRSLSPAYLQRSIVVKPEHDGKKCSQGRAGPFLTLLFPTLIVRLSCEPKRVRYAQLLLKVIAWSFLKFFTC